ncbi:polyprenyl synthetase family protein [Arcanobacterium hippocoleae]
MTSLLEHYRMQVNERIFQAIDSPDWLASMRSSDFYEEFSAPAKALLSYGKRTRAAFAGSGWQLFTAFSPDDDFRNSLLPITAGAALELYQGSALIHDDIIDTALSRRGLPAAHIAFRQIHESAKLKGKSAKFGLNSAILLGDFLLSLACHTFEKSEHISEAALTKARLIFHGMTAEVAFGQYLDNRREFMPFTANYDEEIAQSFNVIYHKSARYSVECPLKIGAALAGATDTQIHELSKIGIALGEAFQLRDDQLGVFGDESATGKPSGGDLIEGKRTVLIGLTRKLTSASNRELLDSALGKPLTGAQISELQNIIKQCGAYEIHEEMIQSRENAAKEEIGKMKQSSSILNALVQQLSSRKS